jgi:hypothetical protein
MALHLLRAMIHIAGCRRQQTVQTTAAEEDPRRRKQGMHITLAERRRNGLSYTFNLATG